MDLTERAKKVKAVVLDSDGVIFTGHVIEGPEGPLAKIRSHADGQGISLLRSIGIVICCITGESGINASFLEGLVKKWNNLPSVTSGNWKPVKVFSGIERKAKVDTAREWLASQGLTFDDCAAMGDDMTDYDILGVVGLAAAPAQAEDIIKKRVHFVAKRRGGDGAIRDLANLILEAKGIDVAGLALR
jgi:3-deoxy-D-manno-octulosonate 8-phosphate phosphatase (KDO 8-P phosphatase)